MRRSDLLLTPGRRLILLLCFVVLGYALAVGLALILGKALHSNMPAFIRISTVMQDVLVFILPAVAVACLCCRRPAELLALQKLPSGRAVAGILLMLFVSLPAMEALIYWNAHWHFPEALAPLEEAARNMESAASAMTETLLRGNNTIPGLILNLMVMAVMAGFSEELLFRGCFQRLLTTGGMSKYAAIWIVAIAFSAFHFQLFGFVPRMLLGAYFGYLLVWTRSIWAPVLAHFLNNGFYVISVHMIMLHDPEAPFKGDTGELYPATLIALSVVTTALTLVWIKRNSRSLEPK